jgi:AraC family transcriptional regulator of adaptative response / DNA-3-methyladenine glycosylase II
MEPRRWTGPGAAQIAARLGVSDRHLRRIFEAQFGVSPLQYLQTRRLLAAKQLIADTRLPMTQVALASGFASVRRFNAAFVEHYGLNPSALRRAGGSQGGEGKAIEVRLGFRPPYDVNAMLGFFARRALRGVEGRPRPTARNPPRAARRTRAPGPHAARAARRAASARRLAAAALRPEREQMLLSVSDSLAAVLPIVISRARAMLDLDAEPMAINAALHAAFPHGDGLRVPGTVDGFELAVRAVLGQQITVAAARTLGSRLVEAFGEPIATPIEGWTSCFPRPRPSRRPAAMRWASWASCGSGRPPCRPSRAKSRPASWRCMRAPTCPRPSPRCRNSPASAPGPRSTSRCARCAGPMRFPGDVALQKALGVTTARAAGEASQAWRPWRSYAVLRAWHAPSSPPAAAKKRSPPSTSQRQASQPEMS